jgi:hypothetical protein
LGPHNYLLLRQAAALLFLLDLVAYLPYARTCLGRGYWGDTAVSRALPFVLVVWALNALSLLFGVLPLAGAAVLWQLFRHFYVRNRWKNLFRGGGAPGFMSHYLAMYLVFFELAARLDASGLLGDHVATMLRIDFGVVLLCSGTYKSLSGYLRGEGMEYGLANPLWGYWFRLFRRLSPKNILLGAQDRFVAVAQVATGVCLIVPQTAVAGAIMCILAFLYLVPTVRLGRLAFLMMAVPLPFLPELGFAPLGQAVAPTVLATPPVVLTILHGAITAYLVILPAVKVMQYLNLFAKIQLPGPLQRALTAYANFVPIIMWRVFTPDVTNFFIRIYKVDRETGAETPLVHEDSTYAYRELTRFGWSMRFLHVTESIALTTVFTTLKYFRSQRPLFEAKLLAYAQTLGLDPAREKARFQYVAILKGEAEFEYLAVSDFVVDLETREVTEHRLVPDFPYDEPARYSHIKETAGYGTYAPRA